MKTWFCPASCSLQIICYIAGLCSCGNTKTFFVFQTFSFINVALFQLARKTTDANITNECNCSRSNAPTILQAIHSTGYVWIGVCIYSWTVIICFFLKLSYVMNCFMVCVPNHLKAIICLKMFWTCLIVYCTTKYGTHCDWSCKIIASFPWLMIVVLLSSLKLLVGCWHMVSRNSEYLFMVEAEIWSCGPPNTVRCRQHVNNASTVSNRQHVLSHGFVG